MALIGFGAGASISLLAEEYQPRAFSPKLRRAQILEQHVRDINNPIKSQLVLSHNKYVSYLNAPSLLTPRLKIFEELISKQAALNVKKKNLKKAYEDLESLNQKLASERKIFAELKERSEEKELEAEEQNNLHQQLGLKKNEIQALQDRIEKLSGSIADFEAKTDLDAEAETIDNDYIQLLTELRAEMS